MDWLPTFAAIAGEPNVKEKLLTGYQADGKTYKVHLDGYNQLPLLTGETDESTRKEIFYFSDDGDLTALRYGDWKLIFLEQKTEEGLRIWMEPFVPLRIPLIIHLRRDPYERGTQTSNTYLDWLIDRAYLLVPAQAYVGKFLATFKDYQPRMKAASFVLIRSWRSLLPAAEVSDAPIHLAMNWGVGEGVRIRHLRSLEHPFLSHVLSMWKPRRL